MTVSKSCPQCGTINKSGVHYCSNCGRAMKEESSASGTGSENVFPSASRQKRLPLKRSTRLIYILVVLAISGLFLYLFESNLPGGAHPVISNQPEIAMSTMYMGQTLEQQTITPEIQNGSVVFSLSLLLQKKIVAFDYPTATGKLPLLAYISADGKLVTAIRMCEPCNSTTFRIEGTEIVCGNCGTRWKLNNLEGISGSCQKYPPDPIPSKIVDNQVQIEETYLKNWKMRI